MIFSFSEVFVANNSSWLGERREGGGWGGGGGGGRAVLVKLSIYLYFKSSSYVAMLARYSILYYIGILD